MVKIMTDKEECNCDCGTYEKSFMLNGAWRLGMYCEECNQLLDYYPQYSGD